MKVVSNIRSTSTTSPIHTRTPASSPPGEAERRHRRTRPHRSSDRVVELAMVQQQPGRGPSVLSRLQTSKHAQAQRARHAGSRHPWPCIKPLHILNARHRIRPSTMPSSYRHRCRRDPASSVAAKAASRDRITTNGEVAVARVK